jgi:hypothetical protein
MSTMPPEVKAKRDEYDNMSQAGRVKSLDYMVMANNWMSEMMAGTRQNNADTRDAIRTLCAVAEANITVANQLRDHVMYLDAIHMAAPSGE